ncbi:hypothetical protein ACFVYE_44330 [Streptomyces sp. NPDC058239]|uniref:hypothetical protein n=1 Tax=unclassified Streptomyces TaxID=2593676 RepID=UPI0036463E30
MHGKKRILALVGVPLGASLALAPAISAEAHAATPVKVAASGAASLPSIAPTAACTIAGKEGKFEAVTANLNGFTPGKTVLLESGKVPIGSATAPAVAGAFSTPVRIGANDVVTATEADGANQLTCVNNVIPADTTGTGTGTGTPVPPGTPDAATERIQAAAAGENDGDATCRQKVDKFNKNADKTPVFRLDYNAAFNNEVAATAGCSAMLAQLRSGVPVGQTQTQEQAAGQEKKQNQEQKQEQVKKHGQNDRGEGRGNR